jgi:hypothetical protein
VNPHRDEEAARCHQGTDVRYLTSVIGTPKLSSRFAAPSACQPPACLGVQRILDAMTTIPAYLRNPRLDILAANQLGRAQPAGPGP